MASQDPNPAAAASASLHVLVVEDNSDTAESMALMVRCDGHEVRVALDGPTALRLAEQEPPDVVLLDIGLPGMDGCEVARRLRERPGGSRPLLIAISGYSLTEVVRRCYEVGVDCYLLKPAEPETLLDLLSGLATRPGAEPCQSVRKDLGTWQSFAGSHVPDQERRPRFFPCLSDTGRGALPRDA
jgi:CheY-like chemotaxis protein